ncbi:MAG: hypothetical protein QOH25_2575 [Acidobacteriota bacterium]|jgi:hypothetical protein|nr:hypothetical protein [Acidobacteriota bacterium]
MKKFIVVLLTVCLFAGNAYSYGAHGHSLVGAIADKRLAKNKPVAARVKQILDGLTLEQAATLPDSIKTWDTRPQGFHVTGHPEIEAQLRAFVKANRVGSHPSHHDFHFTDVPVFGDEEYASGEVGRSDFDIVHMIPFCIRVLKGEEPETNDRAITKAVAVILLDHYFGDIHQPLHVGAEYFDASGNPFEPTTTNQGFADQGGNKLTLFTLVKGKEKSAGKFHTYWDSQTVENAFGSAPNSTVAKPLANKEPANWKLTGGVETWAEQLANEIMPLAREAHTRLTFLNIKSTTGAKDITSGRAEEKKKSGGKFYAIWAGATVKDEIHKAGWRLAALLVEVLQ